MLCRYIRAFKRVLIRYLEQNPNVAWPEAIKLVSNNLNLRYNRTLGMAPADVADRWQEVQKKMLATAPKREPFLKHLQEQEQLKQGASIKDGRRRFKLNDTVIVSYPRKVLDKEADRAFQYKVLKINKILEEEEPYMYQLKDGLNQIQKRLFYASELRSVKPPSYYPVSSLIKSKTVDGVKYVLVRYLDHDAAFDEWKKESSIKTMGDKRKNKK